MENIIQNTNLVLLSDDDYNWTSNHSFEELSAFSKEEFSRTLKLFDDEVWKSGHIAGFSRYQVSNYGRIKRLKEVQTKSTGTNNTVYTSIIPEKILTGHLAEDDYVYVTLKDDNNKKVSLAIHRLIAFVFCEINRPKSIIYKTKDKKVVDHINRVKYDNRAINLRWTDYSTNGKNTVKDYSNSYDYKYPLIDINAKNTDTIDSIIPNESSRWYTKVDFDGEIWKTVRGYEDYRVFVSNYGRIIKPVYNSKDTYISNYYERKGYFLVALPQRKFEKSQKVFRVHQIVAQEFLNYEIGSVDENGKRLVIDHIDTNKHNNVVTNLRICSQYENMHNETTYKLFERKTNYSAVSCRVNAYEYPSGNFIQQFDNYKTASDFFNIGDTSIAKICKGQIPFGYSKKYNKYFIFRNCELVHIDDKTNLWNSKIFNIYDLYNTNDDLFYRRKERIYNVYEYPSGNFLARYNNADDISKDYKLSSNSIWKMINGEVSLSFSKELKKYYVIRRINSDNIDNYKNLFESGLLEISEKNITKSSLEQAYNLNYTMYINLYAYPSGKFVNQFNFVEDVLSYFDNRIKNYTVYRCLAEENSITKDNVFRSYFVMRYVNEKNNHNDLELFGRSELKLMVNQKDEYVYNNIFEINRIHSDYNIDLIYYCIRTDNTAYGYTWYFTRKHEQEIVEKRFINNGNRTVIPVNKYSLNGEYIEHFDDLFDISIDKQKINNIRSCIKGKAKSAYGYIWKDANEYAAEDLKLDKPVKLQQLYFSAYDENNNIIESFKSTKIAAEKYGIVVRKIYRILDKEVYIDYNGIKIKFKKDEYDGL